KENQRLMNALADSVLRESPEELLNDLSAEGIDPEQYADRVRQAMLDAVKTYRQQPLIKARRSHKKSIAAYEKRHVRSVVGESSVFPPQNMRDDFSELVKRTLADRVAKTCSNPDCAAITSGPQIDPTK